MATRKQVSKERILLWMLAAVFGFQASVFAFGIWRCSKVESSEVSLVCPDIGRRYDQTFGVMIATILALLGASKSNETP